MQSSLAVAVGAVIGASTRWLAGEALTSDGFPWATLLVNLLGCAAIGWFAMRLRRGTVAWYFVVTGCLGGFTTASTFAVETRQLVDDGRGATALLYVAVSVVGGIAAAAGTRTRAQRAET
jgi:fluoride exporter